MARMGIITHFILAKQNEFRPERSNSGDGAEPGPQMSDAAGTEANGVILIYISRTSGPGQAFQYRVKQKQLSLGTSYQANQYWVRPTGFLARINHQDCVWQEVLLCQEEPLLLSLSCLPSSEATGHNSSQGKATPVLSPSGWKRPRSFSKGIDEYWECLPGANHH